MEVHVPPKRLLTFNGLHGSVSQKTELFITIVERTSDSTREGHRRLVYRPCCSTFVVLVKDTAKASAIERYPVQISTGFSDSWAGVRLSPLGASATNWPIVPAPDNR
jgi:hypothetical protein